MSRLNCTKLLRKIVRVLQRLKQEIIKNFEQVLIPELNNGQLIKIIRDKYLVNAKGFNKIKGIPFKKTELTDKIKSML